MLAILSAVFGFAAPFLPELLKFFNRKADNAHELAMMDLRLKAAASEHAWKMEEINATADIAEAAELHKPQPSFGVQILDAAKGWELGRWAIIPAFYLFTVLDFLSGMVRPAITYTAFGFYVFYKIARFHLMTQVSVDMAWTEAVAHLWDEQDYAIVTLCLSFWFGARSAQAAFGGSARTTTAGAK